MARFWVGGPCEESGQEVWLVIDGRDLSGMRPASKPATHQAKWPTEEAANEHAAQLNKDHAL